MLVTVVTNIVALDVSAAYGGILLVALIVCLVIKEVISNHPNPKFIALHRSLKIAWIPLTMVTVVLLGQHLYALGAL